MINAIIEKLGYTEGLTVRGNEIVDWPYASPQPSEAELGAWVEEYEAAYDYKEKRLMSMPSIEARLEDLYDDIDKGKLDKSGEFYKKVKAVKDKYPKPGV